MAGTVATIHLAGDLDSNVIGTLDDLLDAAVAAGADRLVLDLRYVTYFQSAALRSIVQVRHRLHPSRGAPVTLVNSPYMVRRIVETCGLTELLVDP